MKKIITSALIFFVANSVFSYDTVRVDLSNDWQVFEEGGFNIFSGNVKRVNLTLAKSYVGILEIKSAQPYSVYINSKLSLNGYTQFKWPIDSLQLIYKFPLNITVFSEYGIKGLSAHLVAAVPDRNFKADNYAFRNAVTICSLILFGGVLLLIRANPQAVMEYFNVMKVFSLRNSDEGSIISRVTSINNVFLYLYCSALIALNLFIYAHGPPLSTMNLSLAGLLLEVLLMAGIVFAVLTGKIIISSGIGWLFRLSEFAPAQFYNFIKLLLIAFSATTVLMVAAFMLGGSVYNLLPVLHYFILGMVILFFAITFFKLNARGGSTVFHLFFYLCASEIIPFVILLNIYFS